MKNRINLYFISMVIFVGGSCRTPRQKLYDALINGEYWDVYKKERIAYGYQIRKDGSCSYYYYDYASLERVEYDDGDVVIDKSWKLDRDGKFLVLQGMEMEIRRWTKDSVFLFKGTNADNPNIILIRHSNSKAIR